MEIGYIVLDSQHVISQNSFNYSIVDLSWFWCLLVSLIRVQLVIKIGIQAHLEHSGVLNTD